MKSAVLLISFLTLAACSVASDGWQTTDDLRTDSLHSATADGRPFSAGHPQPDSRNLEQSDHCP